MVDFLCWRFDRWVHETIYQTICRLPAAHSLKVQHEGDRLLQYWTFEAQLALQYKTDVEYVEHFRELFGEAVRCRLRSATPVGISVSGGLDSSSIACMADLLSSGDQEIHQQIRLYSCVFGENFPKADERRYLQAVLDKCPRFSATGIAGQNLWGLKEFGSDGGFPLDEPEIFHIRSMFTDMLREARCHGCRVVLSGEGGDLVLSAAAYWRPVLIRDVDLRRIKSELGHFWRRSGWSTVTTLIHDLIVSSIVPFMPSPPLQWLRQSRQRRFAPAWVNRRWIKLSEKAESESISNHTIRLPSQSATIIYRHLTSGWYTALLSYINSVAAFLGVEYRFPFLDRRVIAFQLAIPSHLRFQDGLEKVILRKAMVDILPEVVRQRTTRAVFNEVGDYGLQERERAKVKFLLDGIESSLSRYLDAEALRSAWQGYYEGTNQPNSRMLLAPLWLQAWLQSAQANHISEPDLGKERQQ
jgi:asparagine synthase (glutamine-hydrolysing)